MSRRESGVHESFSDSHPSLGIQLQTPAKDTGSDAYSRAKPDTYNVRHIEDSLDRARLGGLTFSLKTVYPVHRQSESGIPTSEHAETLCSPLTNVTLDPRGFDAPTNARSVICPSLAPLEVQTPVHPISQSPRHTIFEEECWEPNVILPVSFSSPLDKNEPERDPSKTPVKPGRKFQPDSPGTCRTVDSGTVASRLMLKFLEDDAKKGIAKQDATIFESPGLLEPESSFKIAIIKQRNPRPTVLDRFLIEALPTSEVTGTATAPSNSKAGIKDIQLIRIPVYVDAESSSSGENNGCGNATILAKAAHLQPEESFQPTPSPPQSQTQSPTRVSHSTTEETRSVSAIRDGLVCMNNDITFRYKTGTSIVSFVRLYNPTDDRYAFKIRSTFPRGFKVKPPQGFVKPRSALDVEILLINSRGVDFSFAKFLIQSFVVDFTDEVITDAMYHRAKLYKAVRETELDINLIGFEERTDADPSVAVDQDKGAAAAYEIRYLRKQLFHMESELQSLREQVTNQSSQRQARQESGQPNAVQCVGCMHTPPLFRFRRNRRFRNN